MRPIVTDRGWSIDSVCRSSDTCKKHEPTEMPFGLRTRLGSGNHVLDGVQIPHVKGHLLGEGHARACPMTLCRELCKKWLNRSICRLGCGLGWPNEAQAQSHSPGGASVIGASWRIRLNRPSAAAMRSYVKLL